MLDYYSKKTNICTAATRDYSFNIINNLSLKDKFLISGSADLFSSTKNYLNESRDFNSKGRYCGKNLRLGVREHCMGSLFNGINYFGYFKTYCSTFLVFSDYLKPALRLSALAGLKTNYIFTHDSILVGQDGPTHQPIETLANLQTLPNLKVIRPSSFVETLGGYMISYLTIKTPVCLILSRQKIEVSIQSNRYINLLLGTLKGAFILKKELNMLKLILISTGSEVALALEICHNLSKYTRLVSIPCIANFLTQSRRYVDKITPPNTYTLIIEFGIVDN
ncbi:hypothetical protein E5P55_00355 [Candidatus Pinguicoccus supinus]|uniref:transketolase n=1 Tax=Candidatus Pinguicoccus supinus TaxID=2529394 RepID=A0A7T0FY99_9BACT|nr:hypothetical protein E5P55_00355 [Candidatus Pinguicoccus supinus]